MREEFVIKRSPNILALPTGVLNYEKLLSLSDEKLSEFYLKLMTEYKEDGWWSEGKIPQCTRCNDVIPSPDQLRRYYGMSLHPLCFKEVLKEDKFKDKGIKKQYWERIATLDLTNIVLLNE